MQIIAHGNVEDYCKKHGMTIIGVYVGNLEDYHGTHPVVVTDRVMCANEYYYLKYRLMKKGVQLVSVYHNDTTIDGFLVYLNQHEREERRSKHTGRAAFGFQHKHGELVEHPANMAVARRILKLRDAGLTMKQISEDEGVHYADGRKLSISTIQVILNNREKYE